MDFTNLIGMELIHKTYGVVKITKVEFDPDNVYDTKLVVKIQHDSRIKKFLMRILEEFFIDLPDIVLDYVDEIEEAKPLKEEHAIQIDRTINLSWYDFDENDNLLSIDNWERSKNQVVSYQYFNTDQNFSIPIVMDNSKLFINVAAACKYLGQPSVRIRGIYSICNGTSTKSSHIGHKWRYAKTKDIDYVINKLKEN